jgi:PAS domain S-box-containing protein
MDTLHAGMEDYRLLFDVAPLPLLVYDLKTFTILNVNQSAIETFGYTREEFQPLNLTHLLMPEDLQQLRQTTRHRLAGGAPQSTIEVQAVTKGGHIVPVEISFSLMYQEVRPLGVLCLSHNLAARKQLEEKWARAQKMDAMGRLAGGIAHDFNNRLTAIQGFADLLLKRTDKDDAQHYYLEQIKLASECAAELARQLLTFSRKQMLHPKILNLNDVVSHWANLMRVLLGENIALHLILGADIGLVKIDPGQLEHVMINLALNAGDAMPSGGNLTIETTDIEISELQAQYHPTIPPGEYVRLLIKDNGCGMSEETMAHLYEPFFTTKERDKGTGLGLFTAYGIIKQNGGFIEVKSAVGEGTTFQIYLPVVNMQKALTALQPLTVGATAGF